MRITFVQYGDFFEAATRFDHGGDETYAAQRYSVDFVRALTRECEDVCVICATASYPENVLRDGVRTLGFHLYHEGDEATLAELVSRQRPTHLVCRSPILGLLRWSASQNIVTLPLLATSFPRGGLRSWFRHGRIARALSSSNISWIGNHSTNSANDLRRIGIDPCRIIPWDWPSTVKPSDWPVKEIPRSSGRLDIFFAGRVQETKGIGDCIRAIAHLNRKGLMAHLTVAGTGELERYRFFANSLGIGGAVRFLGRIPHCDVVRLMHEHDVVVVPSQHSYPEGLPMTIYDAYSSRSPLVVSNHPMFKNKVRDGETALTFVAQDTGALAQCLERLSSDQPLFASLSRASAQAWERLQLPVKWGDLLKRWLSDTPEDRAWLERYSLASGRYVD